MSVPALCILEACVAAFNQFEDQSKVPIFLILASKYCLGYTLLSCSSDPEELGKLVDMEFNRLVKGEGKTPLQIIYENQAKIGSHATALSIIFAFYMTLKGIKEEPFYIG